MALKDLLWTSYAVLGLEKIDRGQTLMLIHLVRRIKRVSKF